MRDRTRQLAALVLVLLATSAVLVPVAAQTQAADAELAVQQPHYISSDVETFDANGTVGYRVQGPIQTLKPQNFDGDNVVNSGVASSAGSLSYDADMGVYRLDTNGNTGTFRLFWTVENRTANGTENTQYEAIVRVTGKASMEHAPAGTRAGLQEAAAKWRAYNATLTEIRNMDLLLQGEDVTNQEISEASLNLYTDVNDPFRLFSGGIVTFHLILITSFGAGGMFMVYVAIWAFKWYKERKKNQRHESIEDAEGEISERTKALDDAKRLDQFNNWEFPDIAPNDHLADGMRALGHTPREAWERLSAEILLPQQWIADKLAAMGEADGWVAVVHDRDDDGEITDAELAKPDDLDVDDDEDIFDQDDVVDLTGEDVPEALFPILCNDDAFESFDMRSTKVKPTDHTDPPTTHDLEELRATLDEQMDWFDDPEQSGELLYEFADAVAKSPYTTHEGEPEPSRRALEEFYNQAQLLRDEFGFGLARLQAEVLEYALEAYDPGASAESYRKKVQEGRE